MIDREPEPLGDRIDPSGQTPGGGALRRAAVVLAAALIVGCVSLAVTAQFARVRDVELRLAPGWIAVAAIALTAMQLAHVALWRRLLAALGEELSPRAALGVWNLSNLARYVPTGALAPVARAGLASRHGVAWATTLASVAYELVISLLGAALLSVWLVFKLPQLEGSPFRWVALLLVPVGLAALQPRVLGRATEAILHRLGRDGGAAALPLMLTLRMTALYAASFLIGGLAMCALVEGLHGLTAAATPTVVAAVALGYVAGVAGFALPGGLGVREVAIAVVLSTVVPLAVSVAAALVLRLAQLGVEVLLALLFGRQTSRALAGPAPR